MTTWQENEVFDWRQVARLGLMGGLVTLYFSAIGMVEDFSVRNLIGTFVNVGMVLAVAGALGGGYLAGRYALGVDRKKVPLAGLVAGAAAAVPTFLLIWIAPIVPRNMFVNISDGLIRLLTLGLGPFPGSLVMAVLAILLGLVGAAYLLLPDRPRRALLNALVWVFGLGLFSENAGAILRGIFGRQFVNWLFTNKSLNPIAAVILFAITFGFSYQNLGEKGKRRFQALPESQQKTWRYVFLLAGLGLLLYLPWLVGTFLSQVLFIVGLYVIMGLGLNIVVGYAGLLDLGYVAFYAFGAYTMAVLTTNSSLNIGHHMFNFWTALPIAVLVGVAFGVLLGFPVLNMRGDYLAIVTLGFGEIIRVLAYSDWLAPIIGGAQGVLQIPPPTFFGLRMSKPEHMYYIVLVGVAFAMFVSTRLRDSRLGRQWMAMREDEDVAEAMGINLVQTKLLAFAIGAGFSAMSGAIFSPRVQNIFPNSFLVIVSINVLSLIIVGGLGSIPGVVVGSFILVGMPELLREFTEYRLLMYGILLIVMMLVKPEGFWPEETRKRELHGGEEGGDLEEVVELGSLAQAD